MEASRQAQKGMEALEGWVASLGCSYKDGSEVVHWHRPKNGWEPEQGVVQHPFSMPPAPAVADGVYNAGHHDEYWSRWVNTFYSNNSLPRRVWCCAEYLSRFLHHGTDALCDASDWHGDLMHHFFGPLVGNVFRNTDLCQADQLVERVACSHGEWLPGVAERLGLAGPNTKPGVPDLKPVLLLSLLSLEGLVGLVSNAAASRPGDVAMVIKALYTLLLREMNLLLPGEDGDGEGGRIPMELDGMLTFLTNYRSPDAWPLLLHKDKSPLWPYLRWSGSLLRQDAESLFVLERLVNSAWERGETLVRRERPDWSRVFETSAAGARAKVAAGRPPSPPRGYSIAPEATFVLAQQGLDITKLFLPVRGAGGDENATGSEVGEAKEDAEAEAEVEAEELHGLALCRHCRCDNFSDLAARASPYGLCLQGVDDQIHAVVDPLNLLLDATITTVPLGVEDALRGDWAIPAEKWTELFLLDQWTERDAEGQEVPMLPKKSPLPLYKRVQLCYPISALRVPAGSIPATLMDTLTAGGMIVTRRRAGKSDVEEIGVIKPPHAIQPIEEPQSPVTEPSAAAPMLLRPGAGGPSSGGDSAARSAHDAFTSACTALQRHVRTLPAYAVRLDRAGCHRGLVDPDDAVRVWRKDACSAETTTKHKQTISLF